MPLIEGRPIGTMLPAISVPLSMKELPGGTGLIHGQRMDQDAVLGECLLTALSPFVSGTHPTDARTKYLRVAFRSGLSHFAGTPVSSFGRHMGIVPAPLSRALKIGNRDALTLEE